MRSTRLPVLTVPSVLALALPSLLALAAAACSHATGDPAPAPVPAAPTPTAAAAGAQALALVRVPVDGLPSIGNPRALVTIVAFTDYQCPFCARAEETLARLRAAYGDDLRIVVAESPLAMHEQARPAALAALAAQEQGGFERMRARLFQGPLDDAGLAKAVADVGLDAARFEADRLGPATAALARSQALAEHLGVHGTPTFFINGRRLVGAQTLETFRAVVDERLAAARALVATGVRAQEVYARTIAAGADRAPTEADDDHQGCHGDGDCKDGDGTPPIGDAVERVPTEGAWARGPAAAPITVVEFADYECPFTARAEATLHALEQAHPGQVRVVFKNLPLPFHTQARPMARAALAAGEQGRFWEMHDRLFAIGGTPDAAAIEKAARDVGLDLARWRRDEAAIEARIDADVADGEALGVKGTPTFFVNGHRLVGAQPLATFETAVAKR